MIQEEVHEVNAARFAVYAVMHQQDVDKFFFRLYIYYVCFIFYLKSYSYVLLGDGGQCKVYSSYTNYLWPQYQRTP